VSVGLLLLFLEGEEGEQQGEQHVLEEKQHGKRLRKRVGRGGGGLLWMGVDGIP
jgi:hypothetical protein